MKVIVIGATGTIGTAVAEALEAEHEVVRASRHGDPAVDLADAASIGNLFASLDDVGAVVCCGASAPLTPLITPSDEEFASSMHAKLHGQVNVVRHAVHHLRDGGSITITSGQIPDATPGSAGGALVNAGLDAFVRASAVEMPRGIRVNAVSPGWVRESLVKLGMDPSQGTPVAEVVRAYRQAVEGTAQGTSITPAPDAVP